MSGPPESDYPFPFLDELDELVNTQVPTTHQANSIPYQLFSPLPPSAYTQLANTSFPVTGNIGSPAMNLTYQPAPPPTHHVNPPTSTSTATSIRRKHIRYGCKLCDGVHFDRKRSNAKDGRNKGVQGHFVDEHPKLVNHWELYVYTWGYRVTYHNESIEDEPNVGSTASAMTTQGAKGGKYGRKEIVGGSEIGVGEVDGGGDGTGELQVTTNSGRTEGVHAQNYGNGYGYGYTEANNATNTNVCYGHTDDQTNTSTDTNAYHVDSYTTGRTDQYAPTSTSTSVSVSDSDNTNTNANNNPTGNATTNTKSENDITVDNEDDITNYLHPALFINPQNDPSFY